MQVDRYTRIVLTVIAVELGWIAVKDLATQVSAQQVEPMPVIVRGVEIPSNRQGALPVVVAGTSAPLPVVADEPLQIEAPAPIRIQADRPIPVESTDRPLLVRSVPDVPAPRPGL
jgi:hypothetical protein